MARSSLTAARRDLTVARPDLTAARRGLTAARVAVTVARGGVKIADKAGKTATLPQMIRDAKSLLRTRLDKLMTVFRASNPSFYAGYLSARVIVDRHGPGDPTPTPPTP